MSQRISTQRMGDSRGGRDRDSVFQGLFVVVVVVLSLWALPFYENSFNFEFNKFSAKTGLSECFSL